MTQIAHIIFDLGGNDFLVPYLQRELLPDFDPEQPSDNPEPTAAVRIFHTDEEREAGSDFMEVCRRKSLPVLTLICPNIVGTGMNGRTRRMAEGIYSGRFFHVAGSEGRTSVIHATDVARAAALAAGSEGQFILTDGTSPSIRDLAEALAFRIDDKRLFTLPAWFCRRWYSKEFYSFLTSDTTRTETFTEVFPDFRPADTLNYLRTHIYDDASL